MSTQSQTPSQQQDPAYTSIGEIPSERVFGNSLLLGEIYSWLSDRDLKTCLAVSKGGFMSGVNALYAKDVPSDIGERLTKAHCPLTYMSAVTSILLMEASWPASVPALRLLQQFPNLRRIKFHLHAVEVRGFLTKDENDEFRDLKVEYFEGEHYLERDVQNAGWAVLGSAASLNLISVRAMADSPASIQPPSIYRTTPGLSDKSLWAFKGIRTLSFPRNKWDAAGLEHVLPSLPVLTTLKLAVPRGDEYRAILPLLKKYNPLPKNLCLNSIEAQALPKCLCGLTNGRNCLELESVEVTIAGDKWEAAGFGSRYFTEEDVAIGRKYGSQPCPKEGDDCSFDCYLGLQHVDFHFYFFTDTLLDPFTFGKAVLESFGIGPSVTISAHDGDEDLSEIDCSDWQRHVTDIVAALRSEHDRLVMAPGWKGMGRMKE